MSKYSKLFHFEWIDNQPKTRLVQQNQGPMLCCIFGWLFILEIWKFVQKKNHFRPLAYLPIHNVIGYGSEPSGYGDDDVLPDLTPFLILGIAILGLSLLFPTAVHIENVGPGTGTGTGTGGLFGMGRKRRYADEGNRFPVKIEYVTRKNIFGLEMMVKSGIEKIFLKRTPCHFYHWICTFFQNTSLPFLWGKFI